jgi:hypothetical protein
MDFTAPSGYRDAPCTPPPITGGARRYGELHVIIDNVADEKERHIGRIVREDERQPRLYPSTAFSPQKRTTAWP